MTPTGAGVKSAVRTVVSSLTRKRGAFARLRAGDGDGLALPAGLRRAVAVDDHRAREPLGEIGLHRGREDRAAREDDDQAGEVDRAVELVERVDQRAGERVTDDHEEVDVLTGDELPEPLRVRTGGRGR